MSIDTQHIKTYLLNLQETICSELEKMDGQALFKRDQWDRTEGGGGRTHALSDGRVIEKCGVNFSHVWGKQMPPSATQQRPELSGSAFEAMGVSLIIHPLNPYAPTTHFNVRFFMAHKTNGEVLWWFGGGFDLTPYYGFHDDCIHWHQVAQQACLPFGPEVYPHYKKWADQYFYLKHRQEPRGIGGIFFDDLQGFPITESHVQPNFKDSFSFVRSVGDHFLPAYLPILSRRKDMPFSQKQRDFQSYRRGRYVEFNLLYDRGTLFGLHSGGRTEAILISLPPQVSWRYDWHPDPNSEESRLYSEFLPARHWADSAVVNT